jgi:hypothetical protein
MKLHNEQQNALSVAQLLVSKADEVIRALLQQGTREQDNQTQGELISVTPQSRDLRVAEVPNTNGVEPGQLWQDCDPRRPGRYLLVKSVTDGRAKCLNVKTHTVSGIETNRMTPGRKGYVLVNAPEQGSGCTEFACPQEAV